MQNYKDVLAEVLIDSETLQARVKELGAQISADYPDGDLLLICILRGGVPFMVDLSRSITSLHKMDFMAVSSYGVGARQSSRLCPCDARPANGHSAVSRCFLSKIL